MKLLQIYKSEPDEHVQQMAAGLARTALKSREVRLYKDPVDYRQLLELIFQHDRVVCWW